MTRAIIEVGAAAVGVLLVLALLFTFAGGVQ